jgi:hypothetical protein
MLPTVRVDGRVNAGSTGSLTNHVGVAVLSQTNH